MPSRGISRLPIGNAGATEGLAKETAAQFKADAIAAIRSNLALCRSASAVIAVAEESSGRNTLYWNAIELILFRLIELGADADDVRDVLGLGHYDWLYEMPTRKRVIRLLGDNAFGSSSWQHFATTMICFECESPNWQHYPPYVSSFSVARIDAFFGSDGRFLEWSRAPAAGRDQEGRKP